MPPGVRSLRMMLHATAVEVLLYVTQLHCQDMLDSLVDSLNIQFHKFQRRNPGFAVSWLSFRAYDLGFKVRVSIAPLLYTAPLESHAICWLQWPSATSLAEYVFGFPCQYL